MSYLARYSNFVIDEEKLSDRQDQSSNLNSGREPVSNQTFESPSSFRAFQEQASNAGFLRDRFPQTTKNITYKKALWTN